MKAKKIYILDTTLRDGEQSPGAVLKPEEKLKIAQALEELGVDIIEAGFPVSSPADFQAVQMIAQKLKKTIVCALARTMEKDIKAAWEAIKIASNPRLHIFLGVSDIHLRCQLKKCQEEALKLIFDSVRQAKSYLEDIEFSPMDATRTDFSFLLKVIKTAIQAGATTINIPDTVGYALPWEIEQLISRIKKEVKELEKGVRLSIHCHNDLGLATANALVGLKAGVEQVECTINGVGERAGNTALEEIVMIIKKRKELGLTTNVNTQKIYPTSRLVSKLMHTPVQPNKAIVGRNAFAHASGIHQDGYLKNKETFEIMKPQEIGLKFSKIILGARSGKHALKYRLNRLGFFPKDEELVSIYESFLKLAEQKRVVTNKDLLSIMKKE